MRWLAASGRYAHGQAKDDSWSDGTGALDAAPARASDDDDAREPEYFGERATPAQDGHFSSGSHPASGAARPRPPSLGLCGSDSWGGRGEHRYYEQRGDTI